MIMYAWKQFWNDFRNGDDAVFWDSNRPRDGNGTKIRPWLQGDKWSFRDVNKKTDFSMYNFHGLWSVAWISYITPIPILFKQKRELSDISPYGYTNDLLQLFQDAAVNNPNYRITPETVKYNTTNWIQSIDTNVLEIVEDGLYQIEITWQFTMPSNYNASNSYQYKFYVCAMQYYDSLWYRAQFDQTQSRWTWWSDVLKLSNTQVIKAWQKITAWYLHTWTSWSATIHWTIKAIKLW